MIWKRSSHDTLRVLVLHDPLSWEERPNAISGLEYELIERFAKRQRISARWRFQWTIRISMLLALQQGRGDVIAAQYTPRRKHRKWLSVTEPYHSVRPMVALLREDPVVSTEHHSRNLDTLYISTWSPFLGGAYGQVGNGPVAEVDRNAGRAADASGAGPTHLGRGVRRTSSV